MKRRAILCNVECFVILYMQLLKQFYICLIEIENTTYSRCYDKKVDCVVFS